MNRRHEKISRKKKTYKGLQNGGNAFSLISSLLLHLLDTTPSSSCPVPKYVLLSARFSRPFRKERESQKARLQYDLVDSITPVQQANMFATE